MDINNLKPTFAFFLSSIGIVLGIPFGAYCLTLKGGASLGAVLVFAIVIGLVVLLAIDRILVSFYNPKKISLIEFVLFVIGLFVYLVCQN